MFPYILIQGKKILYFKVYPRAQSKLENWYKLVKRANKYSPDLAIGRQRK